MSTTHKQCQFKVVNVSTFLTYFTKVYIELYFENLKIRTIKNLHISEHINTLIKITIGNCFRKY